MGIGIFFIFVSAVWSLFLVTRVHSFLGQKFLILSGSNLFDAKGMAISNTSYSVMWLIAVGGLFWGVWLITSSLQARNERSAQDQIYQKRCPMCAEFIQLEARLCKHCGQQFSDEEVEQHIAEQKSKRGFKKCPSCGNWDVYKAYTEDVA